MIWVVRIEIEMILRADKDEDRTRFTRLLSSLGTFQAVGRIGGNSWGVQLALEVEDPLVALTIARWIVITAAKGIDLPTSSIVSLNVVNPTLQEPRPRYRAD